MSFVCAVCSMWLIDRTQSVTTTLGQSGPGNNGDERVVHIPQISKVGALLSDILMSYLGHSLGRGLTIQKKCSWEKFGIPTQNAGHKALCFTQLLQINRVGHMANF